MLRTHYKSQEMILRIKRNVMLYSLKEEEIYQSLLSAMDIIFQMESFAIYVRDFLVVGETQQSALPLITVEKIVPINNIISI